MRSRRADESRALSADPDRLALALSAAALGMWELRSSTDEVLCDPACRSLMGLPPTGAVAFEAFLDVIRESERAAVEQLLHDARGGAAEEGSVHTECRLAGPSGRWLELRAVASSRRFVGTVADITERKERERRADEERRINAILLRVGTAFASELQHDRLVQVITDEATKLSEAQFGALFEKATNERGDVYMLYTLSGAPREAFSKFPTPRNTALFGPTFAGEAIVRIDDVMKDPRYGKNPPYHGMPEGHLPVRSYLAVPVRTQAGSVLGGLFFGHPQPGVFTAEHERLITGLAAQAAVALDNSQLYRALRDSERQLRQLADAMPQIVWASRPDGTVDYYNRRWHEFTGLPEGQIGNESWRSSLHPEDVQRCHDRWYASVRSGEPYEIEYRFRDHRTGEYRWHLGRALPVRDDQGRILRWFGTSTDIHEQKEAVRARDVFLSIASHELRTPLTPLTLQLQCLRRRVEQAREEGSIAASVVHDTLAVAARQVERMSRLVETLLDVSRLTEKRFEPKFEAVDLSAVAAEVIERARSDAERAHTTVTLSTSGPAVGQWDRFRIDQVVTNLLANAIRYGLGKPIEVEVKGDEATVTLVVRDHGIGIAREDRHRIFERFERAVSAHHYGGFGLGLWICRQVVEAFDGTIEVESAPGEGSIFTVTLPRATRAAPAAPVP